VLTQLQLLLFSGLAFFVMLPYLKRAPTITLDTDWIWRKPLPAIVRAAHRGIDAVTEGLARGLERYGTALAEITVRHQSPGGLLARLWPTRGMALWVLLLLLGYLVLYYV
jgi:multicomponent Na+:H+ antiporter subunit D